jgi:uncharacterized protein with LGFP repeats
MHKATRRTAAFCAAIAAVALVGAGCSDDDKDTAKDGAASASAMVQGTTTESAGAKETKIAGADGVEYTVSGDILTKYNAADDAAKKALGGPKGEQQKNPDGGVFQQFDGGVIVVHNGGSFITWGLIRDKWNELGGSQGQLGYPTSDETDTPDGKKQTTFEKGTVTWTPGETTAVVVGG